MDKYVDPIRWKMKNNDKCRLNMDKKAKTYIKTMQRVKSNHKAIKSRGIIFLVMNQSQKTILNKKLWTILLTYLKKNNKSTRSSISISRDSKSINTLRKEIFQSIKRIRRLKP